VKKTQREKTGQGFSGFYRFLFWFTIRAAFSEMAVFEGPEQKVCQ
jgi:hypothetical protein